MNQFGGILRLRRKALRLSMKEMVEISHISQSSLSQFECGRKKATVHMLRRLAEAYQIPYEELVSKNEGVA